MMRMPLLLVLLASAACATDDISGTWNGTWASRTGVSGVVTASLSQHDADIDGTVAFTGSPCFSAGKVTQVIVGDELSGSITAGRVAGACRVCTSP